MLLEILFILFSLVIGYLAYPAIHHKRTMREIANNATHLAQSNRDAFTQGWKAAVAWRKEHEQVDETTDPQT